MGSSAKVNRLTDSVLGQSGGVISFRISVGNRRWALVLRCFGEIEDLVLQGTGMLTFEKKEPVVSRI